MKFIVPLLLSAFLLVLPSAHAQSKDKCDLVISNVTLIDGTGAEPRPGMAVTISGDRIASIARAADLKAPANACVVDAMGRYLIPGLWDMHTHVMHASFLSLFLANGVTGIREMGGDWAQIGLLRKYVREGRQVGPRIYAAGPYVDGPNPVWPASVRVANAQQAKQTVASLKKDGVDFIKIYSLLPRDAYFALVSEAKSQGLPFAGHIPYSINALEAAEAGQKSIEHLDLIFRACSTAEEELQKEVEETIKSSSTIEPVLNVLRLQAPKIAQSYSEEKAQALFSTLAQNKVSVTPTLTVQRAVSRLHDSAFTSDKRIEYLPQFITANWNPQNDVRLKNLTPEEIKAARDSFQSLLRTIGEMHRAGVPILPGTDTPNPYCFPGFSLHDELQMFVEAGFSPMEALQAATRDAARFLGVEKQLGTIETGKIADLVLLDANPLEEISNTKKIRAVISNGKLYNSDALEKMLKDVRAMQR